MSSTADEQYLLELINEARLDPVGDARRYIASFDPIGSQDKDVDQALKFFNVDGSALLQALSQLPQAQPVAFDDALTNAALAHDARMIADDRQEHQLPGEADVGGRISAAGYDWRTYGENIYAYSDGVLDAHAGFMVDWGPGTGGMQAGAGHRTNILDPDFREVGLGIVGEANQQTSVGPQVVTEDFAASGGRGTFILGVAYADRDGDGFYSVGEGTGGLSVAVGGARTVSSDSGGYSLETNATGMQTVTLSGGGLQGDVTLRMDLHDGLNAKIDVVDGHILRTSVAVDVSGPVDTVVALTSQASASTLNGASTAGTDSQSVFYGTAGDDVLTGGGHDRFVFRRNGGHDEIANFRLGTAGHDVIDLSAFAGITGFAQVMHHTHDVDGQATIALGKTSIVLDDISKGMLARHRGDFLLHG